MAPQGSYKMAISPPLQARFIKEGDIPDNIQRYEEEVYRDYNTMTVRTRGQDNQIRELEKKLETKNKEQEKKLKNLIAYYYKR